MLRDTLVFYRTARQYLKFLEKQNANKKLW